MDNWRSPVPRLSSLRNFLLNFIEKNRLAEGSQINNGPKDVPYWEMCYMMRNKPQKLKLIKYYLKRLTSCEDVIKNFVSKIFQVEYLQDVVNSYSKITKYIR